MKDLVEGCRVVTGVIQRGEVRLCAILSDGVSYIDPAFCEARAEREGLIADLEDAFDAVQERAEEFGFDEIEIENSRNLAADICDVDDNDWFVNEDMDGCLIGDWDIQGDGYAPLPALDNEGFAAIVRSDVIQVVASKWALKVAGCSPCYPGQGSLGEPHCDDPEDDLVYEAEKDPGSVYLGGKTVWAYMLPPEYCTGRSNEQSCVTIKKEE